MCLLAGRGVERMLAAGGPVFFIVLAVQAAVVLGAASWLYLDDARPTVLVAGVGAAIVAGLLGRRLSVAPFSGVAVALVVVVASCFAGFADAEFSGAPIGETNRRSRDRSIRHRAGRPLGKPRPHAGGLRLRIRAVDSETAQHGRTRAGTRRDCRSRFVRADPRAASCRVGRPVPPRGGSGDAGRGERPRCALSHIDHLQSRRLNDHAEPVFQTRLKAMW